MEIDLPTSNFHQIGNLAICPESCLPFEPKAGDPPTLPLEHVRDRIKAVACAPNSTQFLTATPNRVLQVFSVSDGEIVGQWKALGGREVCE